MSLQNQNKHLSVQSRSPRLQLNKVSRLIGHKGRVFDMSWSPTGPSRLLSAGEDGAKLWPADAADRGAISLEGVHESEVMRCAWHPRGTHVLTGGADGVVAVWDAEDGRKLESMKLTESDDEVYGLNVLTDEGMLVAGVSNKLQQWNLNTGVRHAPPLLLPRARRPLGPLDPVPPPGPSQPQPTPAPSRHSTHTSHTSPAPHAALSGEVAGGRAGRPRRCDLWRRAAQPVGLGVRLRDRGARPRAHGRPLRRHRAPGPRAAESCRPPRLLLLPRPSAF